MRVVTCRSRSCRGGYFSLPSLNAARVAASCCRRIRGRSASAAQVRQRQPFHFIPRDSSPPAEPRCSRRCGLTVSFLKSLFFLHPTVCRRPELPSRRQTSIHLVSCSSAEPRSELSLNYKATASPSVPTGVCGVFGPTAVLPWGKSFYFQSGECNMLEFGRRSVSLTSWESTRKKKLPLTQCWLVILLCKWSFPSAVVYCRLHSSCVCTQSRVGLVSREIFLHQLFTQRAAFGDVRGFGMALVRFRSYSHTA